MKSTEAIPIRFGGIFHFALAAATPEESTTMQNAWYFVCVHVRGPRCERWQAFHASIKSLEVMIRYDGDCVCV